ncbi:hypothetical protein [Tsukamurella pseudospumae]|uniref:hypothetical protein n=1 Tax=Tsukamurella pseudospumae TaxID=239498 RepID=UPI0011119D60|nr:hypothetical protein [Tsukamurella pseudospumae]
MTTEWTPGQWKRQKALQKPITGVPDHLIPPLVEWIDDELRSPAVRVRLAVELQWTDLPDYWGTYGGNCAADQTGGITPFRDRRHTAELDRVVP